MQKPKLSTESASVAIICRKLSIGRRSATTLWPQPDMHLCCMRQPLPSPDQMRWRFGLPLAIASAPLRQTYIQLPYCATRAGRIHLKMVPVHPPNSTTSQEFLFNQDQYGQSAAVPKEPVGHRDRTTNVCQRPDRSVGSTHLYQCRPTDSACR